jgi:hypothetical protein
MADVATKATPVVTGGGPHGINKATGLSAVRVWVPMDGTIPPTSLRKCR